MNPKLHLRSSFLGFTQTLMLLAALLIPFALEAQVSVSISSVNPTCNGYTNGSLVANATGGTMPYTFAWSNGGSGNTLTNLGAGSFSVTVTDANGNQASGSANLTQPSAVTVNVAQSNVCAGNGNATANASGGNGSYSYLWDNGQTAANATGLSAGLHCVTVTDGNGCQGVGCVTVASAMTLTMNVQGLACFNFCDASVEAIVTGGTPPYSYNWSNGANGSVNPNLGPGNYSVTVTDVNGCTVSGTATVGNPIPINVNLNVVNPNCGSGGGVTGSASVSPSGGTSPYTVLWSTGSMQTSISGLIPGNYGVTVTDFLGCTQTANFSIFSQSNMTLNVAAVPSNACGAAVGSATVTVSGGVAPFTYQWSNGGSTATITGLVPGTYSVIVTGADGCAASAQATVGGIPGIDLHITGVNNGCAGNGSASAMVTPGTGTAPYTFLWNTGVTTPIINNLSPGTYSVTATDANGCTATDQITVSGSSSITVTATGTAANCFNTNTGSATATPGGGAGPFTYIWSNGLTTQTISNLASGTYFVTVTQTSTGCTAFTSAFVGQPTQVTVTVSGVNGACNTLGSATAVATGGTPGYTYTWSNSQTGATITNLNTGAYAVTATDTKGCAAMGMVSITNSNAGLNVTVSVTHAISAVNANDGAVSTAVSGGTAPYTYAWNTGATTSSLTNLGPGTYTVTVTSSNGCTGTGTVTLVEPSCIGDRVWDDMDRDGCQDPGEFGFAGVVVILTGTTSSGASVNMTTVTANNGYYIFNNLEAGTYQVQFNLPTGYAFSPANACTDDFSDSDANAAGNSGNVSLPAGNCKVTVDAGIYDVCLNVISAGEICCDQTICGPGNDAAPINSVVAASGGGSATQYMWMYSTIPGPYDPNTWLPIPTAMGASYDPGLIYETTYFIRCAKAANCTDWKESNIVAVIVDDVAVAEISGLDLACVGDQVTYSATSNGAGATYSWNFGPWATPSTSTSQNPTVTWNQAGVVYITLSVTANGCTSTDQMGVAISNSPIICGNAIVINVNDLNNAVMVDWTVEQIPGNYEFSIQRSSDGINYSPLAIMPQTQQEGQHTYSFADYFPKKGNSYYRVEMLENGQHMKFSNEKLMQRFSKSQAFLIHPNPVVSQLTIESNGDVQTPVQIEVLNIQGKKLETMKLEKGALSQSVNFDHLQSGAYLLRFRYNNGEQEVIKFFKE